MTQKKLNPDETKIDKDESFYKNIRRRVYDVLQILKAEPLGIFQQTGRGPTMEVTFNQERFYKAQNCGRQEVEQKVLPEANFDAHIKKMKAVLEHNEQLLAQMR